MPNASGTQINCTAAIRNKILPGICQNTAADIRWHYVNQPKRFLPLAKETKMLAEESFVEQLNSLLILDQLAPLKAAKEHLPKDIINILDPPSTECPPLVEIKQEGKASIYTTDFYFTNKLSSNIMVPSPGENNTTPTEDQAAADPTLFDTDPLQPGEICLHSWMLYTSQAPVLDLTGEHIKTKEDIEAAFHALNLCPQEVEEEKSNGRKDTRRTSKSK